MPKYTIERGRNEDFVFVGGEPIGVITRRAHNSHTCTIEGRRVHGANGECRPGEHPAWLVKRARAAGLIGVRRGFAPAPRRAAAPARAWTAVEGWEISYPDDQYGGRRTWFVNTWKDRAAAIEDLDARGVHWRIREVPKGMAGIGAPRVSDPAEIEWRKRFNADTSARELVNEMSRLREIEPRPMHKLYGTSGGTPEQRAAHAERIKQWGRSMAYLRRLHKPALERDNAAFRAEHGLGRRRRRR